MSSFDEKFSIFVTSKFEVVLLGTFKTFKRFSLSFFSGIFNNNIFFKAEVADELIYLVESIILHVLEKEHFLILFVFFLSVKDTYELNSESSSF